MAANARTNHSIELMRLIAVMLITLTHARSDVDSDWANFILRELPTYGTAILSIVSGYLFFKISRHQENLFMKKVKSLAIPYLIANLAVLSLVLLAYYGLGLDVLNRLSYDWSIVTKGIFSLTGAPINPPTFFVRDIFIVFSIIALVLQRDLRSLIVLIPFLAFGTLILRLDIAFLFCIGCLYAIAEGKLRKQWVLPLTAAATILIGVYLPDFLKFPSAFFIFTALLDLKFSFFNTGRYSYLLHLYHSPIMVCAYPVLDPYLHHTSIEVAAQIFLAMGIIYGFFLVTKRFEGLKVLSGGR